jgi:hypothetical protein
MWNSFKRRLRDFTWGIDTAHAVWHGLPVKPWRRTRDELSVPARESMTDVDGRPPLHDVDQ